MKVHQIPFQKTGYFSNFICDYLDKNPDTTQFYGNFPELEGFKQQMELKKSFNSDSRITLVENLKIQYKGIDLSNVTKTNIDLLKKENTFTITTGHQLNIFTGPLYFLYKIVSTLNLTKQLNAEFPNSNFVPVYWMATEDHDFDEINYFNFKNKKISWERENSGAVGRLNTDGFDIVFEEFSALLGSSKNEVFIKNLFNEP